MFPAFLKHHVVEETKLIFTHHGAGTKTVAAQGNLQMETGAAVYQQRDRRRHICLPSKIFALSGVYSLLAAEGETDLGYRFKKAFWNQGYVTEASAVCLQYGFEKLGLPFIVARIQEENKASIKVAEKLGMRFWKETDFHGQPGHYYRITKEYYFSHPPVR